MPIFNPRKVPQGQKLKIVLDGSYLSADLHQVPITIYFDASDPAQKFLFQHMRKYRMGGFSEAGIWNNYYTFHDPNESKGQRTYGTSWNAERMLLEHPPFNIYIELNPISISLGRAHFGVTDLDNGNSNPGQALNGYGFYVGNGYLTSNNVAISSNVGLGNGTICGLYLNKDNGHVYAHKNGVFIDGCDPFKGINPLDINLNIATARHVGVMSLYTGGNWGAIYHHIDDMTYPHLIPSNYTTPSTPELRRKLFAQIGDKQIPMEVGSWEDAEAGAITVKVPVYSSSTDPEIIIGFDSSQADNDQFAGLIAEGLAQTVFGDKAKSVWHMGQDPDEGTIKDSMGFADLTDTNMDDTNLVVGSNGSIVPCLVFDGSTEKLASSALDFSDLASEFTLTIKAKFATATAGYDFLAALGDGTTGTFYAGGDDDTDDAYLGVEGNHGVSADLDVDRTNHAVYSWVFDGTDITLWKDGVASVTSRAVTIQSLVSAVLTIGNSPLGSNGAPAEVETIRLYSAENTDDEIKAEHNALLDDIATITSAPVSLTGVDALVVGGGGGGAKGDVGGGGGAGGYISQTNLTLTDGSYNIVVGAGGAAGADAAGTDGGDSSALGYTADGGGGGAPGGLDSTTDGADGGSGGGGGGTDGTGASVGGTGTVGQGNDGGDGLNTATSADRAAGGGGGSGAAGGNAATGAGGAGGDGTSNSILGTARIFAAGGGGGSNTTAGAGGSSGVGGKGEASTGTARPGLESTGSGGGGAGSAATAAGDGADGIVIIKYDARKYTCVGGTIFYDGNDAVHVFHTNGSFKLIAEASQFELEVEIPAAIEEIQDFPAKLVFGESAGVVAYNTRAFMKLVRDDFARLYIEHENVQKPAELELWPGKEDHCRGKMWDTSGVKPTSIYSSSYYGHHAFNEGTSLTGGWNGTGWICANGTVADQKLNVDIGIAKKVHRFELDNGHSSGSAASCGTGIKDFEVYGTNESTAFDNTTYSDLTDLTLLGTFQAREHIQVNSADPQYFDLPGDTAYRYYVFRIANNHSGISYISLRLIKLFSIQPSAGIRHYPATFEDATVKVTSKYNTTYWPYFAVDPSKSVRDSWTSNGWVSINGANTNQKFNIDYGTAFVANILYLENGHSDAGSNTSGIKNFTIYGTNEQVAFENITYADTEGLTELGTFVAKQHYNRDKDDSQFIYFNNTQAFRYYILRIADNWGLANYITVRRITFMSLPEKGIMYVPVDLKTYVTKLKLRYNPDWQLYSKNMIGSRGSIGAKKVWDNLKQLQLNFPDQDWDTYARYPYTYDSVDDVAITKSGFANGTVPKEMNFGSGWLFDDTDDDMVVPDPNLKNDWTIEAVINPTTFADNDGIIVLGGEGIIYQNGAYSLLTGDNVEVEGSAVVTGEEIHLAATKDGYGNFILYEDGVDVGVYNLTTSIGLDAIFEIGTGVSDAKIGMDACMFSVSRIVRSPEYIAFSSLNSKDQLIDFAPGQNVLGSNNQILAYNDLGYSDQTGPRLAFFDLDYVNLYVRQAYFDSPYGIKLGMHYDLRYGDSPVVRAFFDFFYSDRPELIKYFDLLYNDSRSLIAFSDLLYHITTDFKKYYDLNYSISERSNLTYFDLKYDLKDLAQRQQYVDMIYAIIAETIVQESSIIVEIDGQRIWPHHINYEYNIASNTGSAEVQTFLQEEYLLPQKYASELRITDDVGTHIFLVEIPFRSKAPGKTNYAIPAASPNLVLSRAAAITREFPAGMVSDTLSALAAEYGVSLTWDVFDWYLPAGALFANNETPLEVIRKVSGAIKAAIQSNIDGTLSVIKRMKFNVPYPGTPTDTIDWNTATPDHIITDQRHFFGIVEEPSERTGWNIFEISDHSAAKEDEWLEQKDLPLLGEDEGAVSYPQVSYIFHFRVPWYDPERAFSEFKHSGGEWVSWDNQGEQIEVIEEEIEIIQGEGKATNPIYNRLNSSYLREPLGTVTYDEDGTVYTNTKGQSILLLQYETKYYRYRVTSPRVENVQFYLERPE